MVGGALRERPVGRCAIALGVRAGHSRVGGSFGRAGDEVQICGLDVCFCWGLGVVGLFSLSDLFWSVGFVVLK